jgi:hypothetical protein
LGHLGIFPNLFSDINVFFSAEFLLLFIAVWYIRTMCLYEVHKKFEDIFKKNSFMPQSFAIKYLEGCNKNKIIKFLLEHDTIESRMCLPQVIDSLKDFSRFSYFEKSWNFIKNSINFNVNCQNNVRYKQFLFFLVDKMSWNLEKNKTGLSLNISLSKNPVTTPYHFHCKSQKIDSDCLRKWILRIWILTVFETLLRILFL